MTSSIVAEAALIKKTASHSTNRGKKKRKMLRRFGPLRSAFGSSSRAQYEQTAKENLHMRAMLWTRDGKFQPLGLLKYLYEKSFYTITTLVTIVGTLWVYHYAVIWATGKYTDRNQMLFDRREEYLRSTGKLKSDTYLVKPLRQIEDPDLLNVPCPTLIDEVTGEPKRVISLSFLDEDDERNVMNKDKFAERKFHR